MRNLLNTNLDNLWFYVQHTDKEERKNLIKYIIGLNKYKSSFIDYSAKYFLAGLIDESECYHNQLGYSTPVKEFLKMGWYIEDGKKIDGSPMYKLDFNKVMEDKPMIEDKKNSEPIFTHFKSNDSWVHGELGEYRFGAKLFDEGSVFGINKGRVSKLSISHPDCNCVMNYERGWDVKPSKEHSKAYKTILNFLESAPQRFTEELKTA